MAAITYTSSAAHTNSSGFFLTPPKYNEKGVQARTVQYAYPAAFSANDVLFLVPVAKGGVMLDGNVQVSGISGGGSMTIQIGDSNNTSRYGVSLSATAGAVVRFTQGLGYSYSADDVVRVTITTTTTATTSAIVRLTVFMAFDQAGDGNAGSN